MDPRLEFLPLLLILFLVLLVPPLLSRFRWLPVVGEIVVGIVVGRSGFNLVRSDPTLEFLAEIRLAILMFLSGLEIDFSLMLSRLPGKKSRASPLFCGAIFHSYRPACGGYLEGTRLSRFDNDALMVGLILSTTSLGVVLPVLKEGGLRAGPFGQTLLLAALLADFATMLLITVYVTLKAKGLTLDVLLVGLFFIAALVALRVGRAILRQICRKYRIR